MGIENPISTILSTIRPSGSARMRQVVLATAFIFASGCRTWTPDASVKDEGASPSPGAPFACTPGAKVGQSQRFDCLVGGKTIHMVVQRGSFAENSRDNAQLFSGELENGTLALILQEVERVAKDRTPSEKEVLRSLIDCLNQRLHESVSQEFAAGIEGAYAGYLAGRQAAGAQPKFTEKDIKLGAYAIETGVLLEGLQTRVVHGGAIKAAAAITDLVKQCGGTLKESVVKNFLGALGEEFFRNLGMSRGCSGFVAAAGTAKGGELIHSRNMDGDLVTDSWNNDPTIYLIQEPGAGSYPFVATATAGLAYPGGVSGFNSQGISVSIHEMSTVNYNLYVSGHKSDIAPYVLQRILRNAGSVDDAIKIVQGYQQGAKSLHIAAWTILVSDGQRNEAASIEFSGDRIRVSRQVKGQSLGQSNHFLNADMTDQQYTRRYNNFLESRSRLTALTCELDLATAAASGPVDPAAVSSCQAMSSAFPAFQAQYNAGGKVVDVDWAIRHIAGHYDGMGKFRSVGRTVTKIYTAMSTVAVPFKHAAGELPEMWFTIGDARPIPHSHFAGFGVDFAAMELKPLALKRVDYKLPSWEKSIWTYYKAKAAAHEGDGKQSIELLDQAVIEAKADGIDEIPYIYMRARMLQVDGDHDRAIQDWNWLWAHRSEVDKHQQALIALNGVISSDLATQALSAGERSERLGFAEGAFKTLFTNDNHPDLKMKWDAAKELTAGKKVAPLPAPDFTILD